MNTEALNRWLTLTANVGVIAGIVFLAVEIRQNTDMMRAQTRSSVTAWNGQFIIAGPAGTVKTCHYHWASEHGRVTVTLLKSS